MITSTYNFKRVYVWENPVRFFHWTTVITVFTLVVTGLLIANPPPIINNVEPANSFWFGYVRVIHYIAAYILIAVSIFRLYWAFAGNRFAKWNNFIPLSKKSIENILYVLRVDIFLMKDKKHKLSNISIGHNYLAAFSYFIMAMIFLLQTATGFALVGDNSTWFLPKLFHWVVLFFGGDIVVRYIHHILTWLFLAFIVIHVYLVLYHDYIEARGEASAMISGFKFIRAERLEETENEIIEKTTEQMWKGDESDES